MTGDVLNGRYGGAYVGFDANYVGDTQGQFGNASAVAQGFPVPRHQVPHPCWTCGRALDSKGRPLAVPGVSACKRDQRILLDAGRPHIFDASVRFPGLPATWGGP